MNKLTNEQIEQILEGAPEGATHYAVLQYDFIETYIKIEDSSTHTLDVNGEWFYVENLDLDGMYEIQCLYDLREILSLRQEVETLKKDRDGWKHDSDVCNKAFEDCSKQCDELIDENQALAAHVENLSDAINQLTFEIAHDPSEPDYKSFGLVMDTLVESPQTSLAEVRAQQAEESFLAGYTEGYGQGYICGCPDLEKDARNEAKQHANKIRNGD